MVVKTWSQNTDGDWVFSANTDVKNALLTQVKGLFPAANRISNETRLDIVNNVDLTAREIAAAKIVGAADGLKEKVFDMSNSAEIATFSAIEADLPAMPGNEERAHTLYVKSLIYSVQQKAGDANLLGGDAANTVQIQRVSVQGDRQRLQQVRKAILSQAQYGSSEQPSKREWAEFYHAVAIKPDTADGTDTGVERINTMGESLSMDLLYRTSSQMPHLLSDSGASSAMQIAIINALVQHIKVDHTKVALIQAIEDDSTTADKLSATVTDDLLQRLGKLYADNVSLWRDTDESEDQGIRDMLSAINGLTMVSSSNAAGAPGDIKEHILLWAATQSDPTARGVAGGRAYDTDTLPAGLSCQQINNVLAAGLDKEDLYKIAHIVSSIETADDNGHKITTKVNRAISHELFVALTVEDAAIACGTGYSEADGSKTFELFKEQ